MPVPGEGEFGFAASQFGTDSIAERWAEPVAERTSVSRLSLHSG